MKEIEEATELRAVLENPLDFIDSTDREEIISQIPDLFRKIAEMLFERYDILICDSKGKEHFYSFAEINAQCRKICCQRQHKAKVFIRRHGDGVVDGMVGDRRHHERKRTGDKQLFLFLDIKF